MCDVIMVNLFRDRVVIKKKEKKKKNANARVLERGVGLKDTVSDTK